MGAAALGCARYLGRAAVLLVLLLAIPANAAAAVPGWTFQPTTLPLGAGDGAALVSVSCPTSSFCLAVGNFKDSHDTPAALYATSNGTAWRPGSELLPAGALSAGLSSVSCASPSRCVAVGTYVATTGVRHPLAEHWDGSRWSQAPSR